MVVVSIMLIVTDVAILWGRIDYALIRPACFGGSSEILHYRAEQLSISDIEDE